jgi:hypothetical protein
MGIGYMLRIECPTHKRVGQIGVPGILNRKIEGHRAGIDAIVFKWMEFQRATIE